MKVYDAASIRNVAVVGHGGCGKTQLVSALLFAAGMVNRLGLVDDGTTVTDYDCQAEAGCVTWGQQEIVGPDGSWSGSFEGLIDPAFTERAVAVLSGTGSYSGMTFVVMAVAPLDEAPSVVGLVYEGDAPPLP